ncbi:rhomboid family intramembrane serine protease [Aureimonas sp. ME7]|uniref:rhomboid family intramembrane serine protease n=1 Tax=Aureimonas sp. ME7 TaxID=2744252 RepID=UPI001FCED8B6|nr:rhomboid family intramembrane serine protease [Aureimonas sp. ME7]
MSLDPQPRMAPPPPRPRVPAFNVPTVVLVLLAGLVIVHWVRSSWLSDFGSAFVLLNFGFFAGCYGSAEDLCQLREAFAPVASPLTHAFLHGDWTHLVTNGVWMLAFGTPVARRLGNGRFLLFCAVGAIAGAAMFYALNPALIQPMIGASGVVSALMGGAARFAIGSSGMGGRGDVAFAPRLSIARSLTDRTVLFFTIVFFATNFALGSGSGYLFGEAGAIAWEAHVGGFLFGFLAFAAFDPRRQHPIGVN